MLKKNDMLCLACGEPKGSCVRCRSEAFNHPTFLSEVPKRSWVILIIGGIASMVLMLL